MLENKKVIVGGSILIALILIFTSITFFNNLKLSRELQAMKDGIEISSVEELSEEEVLDGKKPQVSEEDANQSREEVMKKTMMDNIRKKSDDAITQVVGMERVQGNTVDSLEEATDNMVEMLNTTLVTILIGMEAISGYLALVLILIGSIGTALTGRAPFVRKGFIALIVLGPIIFIVSNYGPALLNLL